MARGAPELDGENAFLKNAKEIRAAITAFREEKRAHVCDARGNLIWDEATITSAAGDAFFTLWFLAVCGDRVAARDLVDRCLGVPDQPFREKAENMTLEDAKKFYYSELRNQGLSEETARAMVEAAMRPETEADAAP